jgi:hypothetical protein
MTIKKKSTKSKTKKIRSLELYDYVYYINPKTKKKELEGFLVKIGSETGLVSTGKEKVIVLLKNLKHTTLKK